MKKNLLLTSFLLSVVLTMGQTTGINKGKQSAILKFGSMAKAQKSDKNRMLGQHIFNKSKDDRQQEFALKSAQAVKQRLDSYSYQEDGEKGKAEFVYDANGMLTQEREYYWDESAGKMVLESVGETTYDAGKNRIQYVSTYLDETTNQFITEYKETYSYDKNGNMTQSINNYWDTTNNQAKEVKTNYTYDSGKNLIQSIMSYFDDLTNQFIFWYKDDYKYNGNNKEIQHISYIWDSYSAKEWEPNSKTESTYDSQSNLILSLKSGANNVNNTWTWALDNKYEYTYDSNGIKTQYIIYDMDNNNQWKLHDKIVYVIDDNRNTTQNLYYFSWDTQTNQWDGGIYKEEYTFNNDYTKNDLILPFDYDDAIFTHMITEIKGFDWDSSTNEWVAVSQMSPLYSPQNVTAVNQRDAGLVSVFPNPCSEFVSVSFPGLGSLASFELFDAQGRRLILKEIGNNEKLSLQGLNSGIYLYNLNIDGKIQRGKLVKE
jgi:hypothetical protein